MQKEAVNTWSQGLISDLNPLSTPNEVMTDCINGTITTFNGNEFSLQTDAGNVKLDKIKLEKGFIPLGMKEYGGVMYIASYNPITKDCEIGSFPSTKTIYDNLDDNKKPHYSTDDLNNPIDKISINLSSLIDSNGNPIKITDDFFKIYKDNEELDEKELLQLNPGDQYKIKYNTTNILANDLISDNNKNRKLFKIKYYIKSKDGTLKQITKDDIGITNTTDPLKGFTYFKSTSPGVLSVSYEPESLDIFNIINIVNTNEDKSSSSISTSIYGNSNSLNKFKGIKLILYKEENDTKTKLLEKYLSLKDEVNNKLNFIINNLEPSKTYVYEFIPFSKYNYFIDKKQIRKVITDTKLSSIDKTVTVFKYFSDIDNDSLLIQFDYNTNKEYLDLYLELYDPWSDVSTIKKVDNPSSFSINNISFDTKLELGSEEFNDSTIGGININDLLTEEKFDPIRKPILGSKKYIRKDFSLRKNHFYIVRICSINQDGTIDKNIYRVLYTSSVLNDKNNNDNINDFGAIDVSENLVDIDFDIKLNNNINSTVEENSDFTEQTKNSFTENKAYKISSSIIDESFRYEYNHSIKKTKGDSIKVDIKNNFNFCKVQEDSINTNINFTPTIKAIEDLTNEYYKPNSIGKLEIKTIDKFNFELNSIFSTNRNMIGIPFFTGQVQRGIFNSYPIISSLLYNPRGIDINLNSYNTYEFIPGMHDRTIYNLISNYNAWSFNTQFNPLSALDIHSKSITLNGMNHEKTTIYPTLSGQITDGYKSNDKYYTVGNDTLKYAIDHLKSQNKIDRNIGSVIACIGTNGYFSDYDCAKMGSNSNQYNRDNSREKIPNWKKCIFIIEKNNNEMVLMRIHNSNDIIEFFNNVHVCSYKYEKVYAVYPDSNKIYTFNNTKTIFKYDPIDLNISIKANQSIYKFYSKLDSNYIDFNKTNIVKYITLGSKDEILIDENNFPKLKQDKVIEKKITLDDYNIIASTSETNTEYNLLSDGENAYNNTLVAKPIVPNGSLFIKDGKNIVLSNLKDRLKVVDPSTGVKFTETSSVTENNFKIMLEDFGEEAQMTWYANGTDGSYKSTSNELTMKIEQYE